MNPAYGSLTGLDTESVRGQTPTEIMGADHGAAVEARYRECVERAEPMEYERLEGRAERLKNVIETLRAAMTSEDILAVKQSITFEQDIETPDSAEKIDSKYRPNNCSHCGQSWDRTEDSTGTEVRRLGAHVWRCGGCGHVRMGADPSHQNIGSHRR